MVALRTFRSLVLVSTTLASAACASTPTSDAGAAGSGGAGTTAGGNPTTAGGNAGGAGGTNTCPGPGYHVDAGAIALVSVGALLTDSAHAPLAGVPVQVCGLDVCFYGTSIASGRADVSLNMSLERPAYKYGDGFEYAKLAVLLPATPPSQDLGSIVALRLPSYAEGSAFPASGSVTQGKVTLTLQAGTSVVHDVLTYSADQLVLRAVEIPLGDSTQAVDPSLGFARAYAVAPVATTFCPSAALSLPNADGWAVGSEAEIWIQGLEVDEEYAPYAAWTKVADAQVSADGSTIQTTSGGIPILSAIGVRKK
ncbi:MAG TPA: hypothetical protein VGI10_30305 [Polyangiaceae bacterium]|jgi:hypothetical protein